ncbi:hypothetical protein GCM10010425_59740 [Streptomyces spororaveus]|uniref:Integrase n=2 Tax=Streptomyces TaxID=1883 RepID=A0ABQ3T836_9ACTN|nr:hypothetical protein Sspor_17160 [Streptomyces spororaveus]
MTNPAPEHDPYELPMPGPDTPVVPRAISAGSPHTNSRFADLTWSMAPLIDSPGTRMSQIHWRNCPDPLRGEMKLAAWTMINGRLRPTYLQTRGARARTRTSAPVMQETCRTWMRFARWLDKHGITSLAACTEDTWRVYATECWGEGVSRRQAGRLCSHLTALWQFDQLSACPRGVATPPWETEGVDGFLPAVDDIGRGENTTEPLDPRVLGPLLVWAVRFVDDFADDILAGWAEHRRLCALAIANRATPAGQAVLEARVLPLVRGGTRLPTTERMGTKQLARTFLAAVTGASLGQVDRLNQAHGLSALATERPGPCPLPTPVTGRIADRPWREHLDFNEAADLTRHLGTAAMIICLYLTGMRPQEVQGLRSGCCPDPEPVADGTPGRHLIRGHHYKNVTDEDGNHLSAGEEREVPWVAITPVVHAIRVLERMVPDGGLLLSAAHHDFASRRNYHGAVKNSALNKRIEDFITWANHEAHVHGLAEQVIPEDPHGAIGLARFRRTLAWHVARRPGGLIALAIQYGHMRTVLDARVSAGYGSRSRGGIHSVLDVETALAAADTAARLRDQIAGGAKVSGPAARRALTAAAHTPRFEGRIVPSTFAKKAAAILARDGVVLFDNPDAFLICAFKRDNALCEPDPGARTPRQYDCRPGCGNTVRTDTHARQLRERADDIDELAAHSPDPVGRRLHANADKLREMAAAHDAAEAVT